MLDQGVLISQGDYLTVQPGGSQVVENLAIEGAGTQVELLSQVVPVDDGLYAT